jgi:hypothetical protein
MKITLKVKIVGVLLAPLFFSCNSQAGNERVFVDLAKTGEIELTTEPDQPELIWEGLRVDSENGMAYGVDIRKDLPFSINLNNGLFQYFGGQGAGPSEFTQPLVLALKDDEHIMVYDIALDKLVTVRDNEVVDELSGYSKSGLWIRGVYAFYWNGNLVHALKEPDKINALRFDEARPIGLLNVADSSLTLKGEFSPSLDDLDPLQKYPLMAFDKSREVIYYTFRSDYSVMQLDLNSMETSIASSYRPSSMRTRTIPFDHENAYHFTTQFARQLNEDRTQLVGIDLLDEHLVVVHQNMYAEFLDDQDPQYLDHFGVVYELPDLTNPREFTLPGKFLGTWGNRMLIEENDDVMEYTIGFYEFEE